MTVQSTTPQRYQKKVPPQKADSTIGELRAEAKALGINSYGLDKNALAASIKAVRMATQGAAVGNGEGPIAGLPNAELQQQTDLETVIADTASSVPEKDGVRLDDAGQPLGPNNIRRVPLGSHQLRLGGDPIPGFYTRWINDVHGRVDRAKRAGYTHVTDMQGNPVWRPAGEAKDGGGLRAYYMKQPIQFREEDNKARSARNDEIDHTITRGKYKTHEGNYIPEEGIKIERR